MKNLIAIFLLFFIPLFGISQTRLTGIVHDEKKQPVPGANVFVKGTTKGTVTDPDGRFTLQTKEQRGVLVVSFIGYETFEESFNAPQDFSVQLKVANTNLDDVMVIGYGSVQKKDLTTSVASVPNMDQIESRPVSSVQDFFQGSVAGVTVQQNGGNPRQRANVTIRGMGSFNNESALWVVDGVPYNDEPFLDPSDIESISVLKDAAASAIYGANAGSGVIIVTTKSGASGKMKIEVNAYTGFQEGTNLPAPLNAEQRNLAYNTAADNDGVARNDAFSADKNPWGTVTRTNWIDAVFHKGMIYNGSVRLSAGSDKGSYSANFNYNKRDGILIDTYSRNLNMRLKSDYNLTDFLKVGQNFFITNTESVGANTLSGYSGVIINAIYMPASSPVYDENGNYFGVAPEDSEYAGAYGDVYNPVALLKRPTTKNPVTSINSNIYGELTLLKGLTYRSSYTLIQRRDDYKKFTPKIPEVGRATLTNYLTQYWSKSNKWIWDNQISYSGTFGKHHVDVTGVYSAQHEKYKYNRIETEGYSHEEDWNQYLENYTTLDGIYSNPHEDVLLSVIGRAMYNYNNKYYLTGSIRRDKTSRLAKGHQSGYFPSASVAWRISEESFLKNVAWLNSFKLRGSWGKMGNLGPVSYYSYDVPLYSNIPVMGDGDAQQGKGYYYGQESNPDLKWEASESYDGGFDLVLFDGKLTASGDIFRKNTKGMIFQDIANPLKGYPNGPFKNIGNVRNSGIEFTAGYHKKTGDFKYAVNMNIFHLKNKLVNLDGYSSDYMSFGNNVRGTLYPYSRQEPGQALYSFYLVKTLGIFKSAEEIQNYTHDGALIQPDAKPGDLKFYDANNDGKINSNDKVYMGNAFPDFSYGINLSGSYKNFDLAITLQGVAKSKLFNAYKYSTYNAGLQGYNLDSHVLGAWSEDNPDAGIPRLSLSDSNLNFGTASDWYLEDGSYLRMKNITVGYSLPAALMDHVSKGSSLRVYLSCENLFTISKYSGMDPEVGNQDENLNAGNQGVDMGAYPVARTYTAGVSLKF